MTSTTTPGVVQDGEETRPHADRIAQFDPIWRQYDGSRKNNPKVRILAVTSLGKTDLVGTTATLEHVDANDARLTFMVKPDLPSRASTYVHDVEPVDVADDRTPNAEIGETVATEIPLALRQETQKYRIDRAGPVGGRVLIEQATTAHTQDLHLWREGTLITVDEGDSTGTFRVRFDDDATTWCYQVVALGPAPVDAAENRDVLTEGETNLQAEIDRLRAALAAKDEQFAAREQEISNEAIRMAREHGYCSVVEQTLDRLGLPAGEEPTPPVVEFTVVRRVRVRAPLASIGKKDEVNDSFIESSMPDRFVHPGWVRMDSDWDQDAAEIQEDTVEVETWEFVEDEG